MTKITEAYGPHLVLDAYDCDPSRLLSIDWIWDFLYQMPGKIGMTRIMPPYVFKYYTGNVFDEGISGFVLIAESHISMHTYPERAYFNMDIFSCKNFDTEKAIAETVARFSIGKYEHQVFTRGLEFPKCIPTVARHLIHERRKGET